MVDLGFQGNIFTWNNGRPGDAFVQEWLDRACATSEWSELFPHAKVTHIQSSYLNHNPIFITLSQPNQIGRKKKIPTRFEEKWAYHPDCEGVIKGAWATENVVGSPMFRLFEKIKKCRFKLVQWSWNIFGNFKTQLQARQSALEDLSMQNNPKNLQEIRTLKHEINTLLNQVKFFGGRDLGPYGYRWVIKIRSSSIKEPAIVVGKITSSVSHPNSGNGAHLMST